MHDIRTIREAPEAFDAALARSRAEAPRLLQELLPLDPEERLARLHADQRFVSWGLCELLIRRSCQTAPEQPSEALVDARLISWPPPEFFPVCSEIG